MLPGRHRAGPVAERLRVQRRCSPPIAIVVAPAVCRPAAVGWFAAAAREIAAHGGEVIEARRPSPPSPPGLPSPPGIPWAAAPGTGRSGGSAAQVLLGRRSAACSALCRGERPCSGYELHVASLLAHDDEQRLAQALGQARSCSRSCPARPLPHVPGRVSGLAALSPRSRECMLATMIDEAVTARAAALRPSTTTRDA